MNAIIVGAGPAGAVTALLLARAGIRVTLLERETDFARVFRGEALMPMGLDAIAEMGLGDALASLPQRNIESWVFHVSRARCFSVDEPQEKLGDRAVRVVSQPALLDRLIDEARAFSTFEFIPGATVQDTLIEHERVVGVRAKIDDETRELRANLVIACDGRGSLMRKRAGLELTLLPEHYDIAWFKLPAPDDLRERCQAMFFATVARTTMCYTSWDGRLQYAVLLPKGGFAAMRDADWAEEMAGPAPDWLAEHIRSVRDDIEGPVRLNVMVGRCPSWTAPGLLLLGDAAHPMSPVRAQGINVAFRDAIIAANHLVPALQAGATAERIDAAARAVQTEREPEIKRAQTLQLREARGQNNKWLRPILIAMARIMAPIMGRFQWAQRSWLKQQRDLRHGCAEVKLLV